MDDRPGSLEVHDPVPVNVPVRESLSQLLKLPFWGWGEEKVAFVWTIDPLADGLGLTDYWQKRGIGPDAFLFKA